MMIQARCSSILCLSSVLLVTAMGVSAYTAPLLTRPTELKDSSTLIEAAQYYNQGAALGNKGDLRDALPYFLKAESLFEAAGDPDRAASVIVNTLIDYNRLGDYAMAINYGSRAIPLFERAADRKGQAQLYCNIGTAYTGLNNDQEALSYFQTALPVLQQAQDASDECVLYMDMGVVYSHLGQPSTAISDLEQALTLAQSSGNTRIATLTEINIAVEKRLQSEGVDPATAHYRVF